MKLDKELIEKVASVARLNLTDAEIKKFVPELNDILIAFSKIDKVNTDKVKPSFQPVELKNSLREGSPLQNLHSLLLILITAFQIEFHRSLYRTMPHFYILGTQR